MSEQPQKQIHTRIIYTHSKVRTRTRTRSHDLCSTNRHIVSIASPLVGAHARVFKRKRLLSPLPPPSTSSSYPRREQCAILGAHLVAPRAHIYCLLLLLGVLVRSSCSMRAMWSPLCLCEVPSITIWRILLADEPNYKETINAITLFIKWLPLRLSVERKVLLLLLLLLILSI